VTSTSLSFIAAVSEALAVVSLWPFRKMVTIPIIYIETLVGLSRLLCMLTWQKRLKELS
jgi:hypothetical protein